MTVTKSAKPICRGTRGMDKRTVAKPPDRRSSVISLADERKRREMQELVKLFEQFYERKTRP